MYTRFFFQIDTALLIGWKSLFKIKHFFKNRGLKIANTDPDCACVSLFLPLECRF